MCMLHSKQLVRQKFIEMAKPNVEWLNIGIIVVVRPIIEVVYQ